MLSSPQLQEMGVIIIPLFQFRVVKVIKLKKCHSISTDSQHCTYFLHLEGTRHSLFTRELMVTAGGCVGAGL